MSKLWLNNTDKEVERFHPVCKDALEKALQNLGMDELYIVQHHRYIGSLEMDLVIANKSTDKILCVIEVKRTIPAVYSTRYQYQAMSYVQSLRDAEKESPYYILTNLECSALFKYSTSRPNVYEQLIEPGIELLHHFDEVSEAKFREDLVKQYQRFLILIKDNSGEYALSFRNFAEEIKANIEPLEKFRNSLMPLFYEYIRGAFNHVNRNDLMPISRLSHKQKLVCREGGNVNFKDIFNPDYINNDPIFHCSNILLRELYDLGQRYVDADAITNVLHSVVSNGHEHDGEVPTDIELGNVVMQLIKSIGGELKDNQYLMDPAAGSGNLISSAINVFSCIRPNQLIANDINERLVQLLSLRLGLKFPSIISKDNSPTITNYDIAAMPREMFKNVKYIVMNPPFLASTASDCATRKQLILTRLKELTNNTSITSRGQMPLEGPFIELISNLAYNNTIIACILPHTHFTARGEASAAIRRLLLSKFGLCMIFNYPQAKLFDDVTQNTAVAIGIIGKESDTIKYLYSNDIISDIDADNLFTLLKMNYSTNIMTDLPGNFEGMAISSEELSAAIDSGWHILNISKQEARTYISENLSNNDIIINTFDGQFEKQYRGKIGNSGASDLLYYSSKEHFYNYVNALVPDIGVPGMRNADYNDFHVNNGDKLFLDIRKLDQSARKDIIEYYKSCVEDINIRQRRDSKSIEDYESIMLKESVRIVPAFSILAPRAIRTEGRIFLCNKDTYVSTNFFVFETNSSIQALVYSSWMLSVFFQLECEVLSKNQAGLRKMEKQEYDQTHLPDIKKITNDNIADLKKATENIEFLNLRDPQIRELDIIWAKIIFGNDYDKRLKEAIRLLSILTANRES